MLQKESHKESKPKQDVDNKNILMHQSQVVVRVDLIIK